MTPSLRAFTWPDISGWKGLPQDCTLATVGPVLDVPPNAPRGYGIIGEDFHALTWLRASSPAFPHAVRVWLAGERVMVMDAEILGRSSELEALVAELGAPSVKLDTYFGSAPMPAGEWMYPQIGLTLFVEPELRTPLRVAVYPATTVDDYRRNYRLVFRPPTKFPLARDADQ